MDRSHKMIRMREGTLKLAIPNKVFDNLVHQVEQQAIEDEQSQRKSFSHRQSRVESLLWNHIWPNHPLLSSQEPGLGRSLRYDNQQMDMSALGQAQPLASSPQPMGEFRYSPTLNHSRFPSSSAMPLAFRPSDLYSTQEHPYQEPQNAFPFSNQKKVIFPPSGLSYVPVYKFGAFHSSTQLPELFPSQPLPLPTGTGLALSNTTYEDYNLAQTADGVSNKKCSRPLKPINTYTTPFSNDLIDPQLHNLVQQHPRSSVAFNTHPIDMMLQQRNSTSYSRPRPDIPPLQTFRKPSTQLTLPIPSRPQRRRGNIPTRRDSQENSHETRNKQGDTSFSHGIYKKRRHSVPRKAAVAASAAIARAAKIDFEPESDEVNRKSPKRTWAQVASSPIKEEEPEESVALHSSTQTASIPIKQRKTNEGDHKTWAKVAAGAWKETPETHQKMRASSFGRYQMTGTFKNGRLFKNTKFNGEDMTGNAKQNPKGAFNRGVLAIRTKE